MSFERGKRDDFLPDFPHGRRPEQFGEYPEMMEVETNLAREAAGDVFDHSDLRAPYKRSDYHRMERFYPQRMFSHYNPELNFQFPDPIDRRKKAVKPGGGCDHVGFVWAGTPTLIRCDEDAQLKFQGGGGSYTVTTLESLVNLDGESGELNMPIPEGSFDREAVATFSVPCDACDELGASCEDGTTPFYITVCDECGYCYDILINLDCGSGTSACDTLTITDADGTPATDTILQSGSNSYKVTGCGCGSVTWAVSGDVDNGTCDVGTPAAISNGALSANDGAGSLQITATCDGCGTSATQYIRVTDSPHGIWSGWTVTCTAGSYGVAPCTICGGVCTCSCTVQEGRYEYFASGEARQATQDPGCSPPAGCDSPCSLSLAGANCGAETPVAHVRLTQFREWLSGC